MDNCAKKVVQVRFLRQVVRLVGSESVSGRLVLRNEPPAFLYYRPFAKQFFSLKFICFSSNLFPKLSQCSDLAKVFSTSFGEKIS
ncbi:MAG TPA: hypothetical protein ENJ49_01600 [Candidatus Moranbacteria bacterium]|nr:hypothetical protein [Candidatus Moranbacteria bacterium]